MQYRIKPTIVDAMLFAYTPTGVAALLEFAGADFTGISKARSPGALATANIAGRALVEGQYLVKEDHDFRVMTKPAFEAMYELVPSNEAKAEAAPAPVAVPVVEAKQEAKEEGKRSRAPTVEGYTYTAEGNCIRGHAKQGKLLRYTKGGNCVACAKMKAQAHYYTRRMNSTVVGQRGAQA